MFGWSKADMVGQQIEMLIPPRFRGHHAGFRAGFNAAPTVRAMGVGRELFGLRKDGSEFEIEIGLNPLRTPQGDMVMASIGAFTQYFWR